MNTTNQTNKTIAGMILIGLGVFFLLAQATGWDIFGMGWPLFVLLPGGIFLTIALRSDNEEAAGMIFPGVIVTGTGIILAYQNFTGHWESWAYIWTLYPVFVGLAMRYMGYRTQNPEVGRAGRGLMIGGMLGFVVLGALFELFIFGGGGFWSIAPLIPLLMIGAGLFLLFRNAQTSRKSKRKAHEV